MADETTTTNSATTGEQPAPKTEEGKIDFSKLPKEVQDLFNTLIEDKRQANKEAQAIKAQLKERDSAAQTAEQKRLEEQNQYKELYEKEKAARAQEIADAQGKLIALQRKTIGLEAGLPEALYARLQGNTEEELRADAETLKSALPASSSPQKAPPSGTQKQTTAVPSGTSSAKSDTEISAWLKNSDGNRANSSPRQEGDVLVFGGIN